MPISFPLVGRESESDWLQGYINRLSEGQGGLVLVCGEAGIGKTRLVDSVLAQTGDQITTVTSRAPQAGASPYGLWREALLSLSHLGYWVTASLPSPFGQAPSSPDPFELALFLLHWIRQPGRKLILAIEDLQWSDAASLDLLQHLSGRLEGTPLLIIGIYRSEEVHLSPALRRVLPEMMRTGTSRVSLNALNLSAVESLVRMAAPPLADISQVAQQIYHLTSGLPLFVTVLLEWMRQQGTVSLDTFPSDQTLQEAVDAKLALISKGDLETLETAALVGEIFSFNLLAEILERSADSVSATLQVASQFGIIFPAPRLSNHFQFHHALVRGVLANRVLGLRRTRLHQRIAQVLERLAPDEPDAIAFHYRQAEDPRAIPFLVAAGDRASEMGALRDANERYQQASRLIPTEDPQQGEILLKLGLTLRWHDNDRAVHYWNRALELADRNGDLPLKAWLRHLLIELAFFQGDMTKLPEIEELSALQEQLLTNARYQQMERRLYRSLCNYPRIHTIQIGYLFNLGQAEKAEVLLENLRSRASRDDMHLLQIESMTAAYTGRLQVSSELKRHMSQVKYRQKDYWNAANYFISYLYHRFLYQSDCPDEIDAMIEELWCLEAEIAETGSRGYLPPGYSAAGFYLYLRGDWQEAHHHLVEYVTQEPNPLPLFTWFAAIMLVETRATDLLPAVLVNLPPFHPNDPPTASILLLTWCHAVRAQAHLLQGELDLAKAWLDAADRHPIGRVSRYHRPFIDLTWAEYHRRTGNIKAALSSCQQALEWSESVPIHWLIIKAKRMLGELTAVSGSVEQAVRLIESALKLAHQCRLPFEVGLCELSAGRILKHFVEEHPSDRRVDAVGRRAEKYLRSAKNGFTCLGAPQAKETDLLLLSLQGWSENQEDASGISGSLKITQALTTRQLDVAHLVAKGLTDRQIAATLHISGKTVDHHLRNIFRKLNITNRSALAALTARSRDPLETAEF